MNGRHPEAHVCLENPKYCVKFEMKSEELVGSVIVK